LPRRFYTRFLQDFADQLNPAENVSKTTWERTSVQCLLRNAESGRYYGRWTIAGKQKWVNLDTDVFGIAKLRLTEKAAAVGRIRASASAVANGSATVGDLIRAYEARVNADAELKPASVTSRLVALKKLLKTWPGLADKKPATVTADAVMEWATRFKREGTQYTPPGAGTVIAGNSATSVNRAIDTLRRIMEIAVERGTISANPVRVKTTDGRRLKKKISAKRISLPSVANMTRLFVAMENNGAVGGWGEEAADFCRFLSYSGSRVGEMETATWGCVDWTRKQLTIRGTKSDTSDRIVPLFAELETLLTKVIERRKKAAVYSESGKPALESDAKIFRLGECQKSIDSACKAVGIPRITHHDFRHAFATRCIEAGVDIPTVSKWLGHADGGALAMRTYGHLRQEHSATMAAKVTFGG
jgi:integrase